MEYSKITEAFSASTASFLNELQRMDENTFFLKPADGAWSVADVVEHLCISDKSAYIAMIKNPRDAERDPLEKLAMFEERRRAIGAKYQAPEPAIPKGIFTSKQQAIEAWTNTRNRISELIGTAELTMLGGGFEHPKLGWMTRLEWLAFLTWHTDHHRMQVNRIAAGII